MRINITQVNTGVVRVPVSWNITADRLIDMMRRLDDRTFNKSIKAAKWLRMLDKAVKWAEGRFYGRG